MKKQTIKALFAHDIYRQIEEVIKVDQADADIIRGEIQEYVITDAIRDHYVEIFERYHETPNKPHEGIAAWISGFFGSGKSSFAKMLGLSLEDRDIEGEKASRLLAQRCGHQKFQVLLNNICEKIPTHAVIFDVSTDRGIRSGNQTITEIMYRLFLGSLGYARDLDLAELEITLEEEGQLDSFMAVYHELFAKDWDQEKAKAAFAIAQASKVMHRIRPDDYPAQETWLQAAKNRADITPGLLAQRCKLLMDRRAPGKSLLFVIDEVGQFVARDVQKMLDLQAVVQSLGRIGRGRMWVAVTSQEKLNELVDGLDDKRVELARLLDRFPLQVHLEPSDISEVTSKRVLSKNSQAEQSLRKLFEEHRGRLLDNTRLTADIKLPELELRNFIDLYPLLPYQIDLIIQVVSGLRTQGGGGKHVGGANRTIIKLAQQLLIHPQVDLAEQNLGALARIDQIYDLVSGNIAGEVRGKIDDIERQVDHPLAQSAAKAICLLQYVKSIHRTAENIAAALHPAVDADSKLPEVKKALAALEKSHHVRLGDDGYRIPTPAEDDWERQRVGTDPKPGDCNRIYAELADNLWRPQPSHNFLDTKMFKAGLFFHGHQVAEGDLPVHMFFVEADEYARQCEEMRKRSQNETHAIFWVACLSDAIDRAVVEVFRSQQILSRKEREARTKDETALVAEEKLRLRRHQDDLRRLIRQACLAGSVYFRGNDRSPDTASTDVGKTAARILSQVLPDVFDRFQEAAARVHKKDLEALLTSENLRGLPEVFNKLGLVRDQGGKPVFHTDSGPLAEVLARIENRCNYGDIAGGRYLADEFAKEPFGWDFDAVRLFVVSLVRAGKIEAMSKSQTIENALTLEARNTFPNNNLFRQCSFRTKTGCDFAQLVVATQNFKEAFGKDIAEIEQSAVAKNIREELALRRDEFQQVHSVLHQHDLPGADVVESAINQIRSILQSKEDKAIGIFNSCHQMLKDNARLAAELAQQLIEPNLLRIRQARHVLCDCWPVLRQDPDLASQLADRAGELADLLKRETFYREIATIDQHAGALEREYKAQYDKIAGKRAAGYQEALAKLKGEPVWQDLDSRQQDTVAAPLLECVEVPDDSTIPLLRADIDACPARLDKAVADMMRAIEKDRLVELKAADFFRGGIDSMEQLEAALAALRAKCENLLGQGKKVLIQ